jgi:hypothetical protein
MAEEFVPFHDLDHDDLLVVRRQASLWAYIGTVILLCGTLVPTGTWLSLLVKVLLILGGLLITLPRIWQLNGVDLEIAKRRLRETDASE